VFDKKEILIMKNNKQIISKSLVVTMLLGSLVACGGGSTPAVEELNQGSTAAVIAGDISGTFVEDDVAPTTGALSIEDPDTGEAAFIAQTDTQGKYGQFSVDTNGQWSYTLSNALAAVQELTPDATLLDTFNVSSIDSTTVTVTLTITGSNDVPTVGGVFEASLELGSTTTASDNLTISGGDLNEAVFIAQENTAGVHGTFTINETGSWLYNLTNAGLTKAAIETFTVNVGDGSIQTITINILSSVVEQAGALVKGEIGNNDTVPTVSCDQVLNSISAFENAVNDNFDLTPGQTVCLASGTYSGLDISFGGSGTLAQPITVGAQVPGTVTISGEVSIAMTGEYVVLQGFIFKDGSQDNQVIQTRANSSTPCNNCRITENSLINMDEGIEDTTKWVYIYGNDNRIDHNWFSGKTTRGALLVIDRYVPDGVTMDETFIDRAQIDHNYFGDRPPVNGKAYADSSDNEYEGIRIGTSDSHTGDSYSVVEHNYFEKIQGEAEVISNKSGHNIIRHNTIRDSYGSIVTRHGEYATIENNFIFGDDNPFSGGIRIIDGNHTVINNYVEGARYQASNWNGGIVLTSGNGSTTNGYQNVENVLVANNTIVDSVNSLNVFGGKESTEPDSVYFINNIIANAVGPVIKNAEAMPTNSTFAGNLVYGTRLSDNDDVNSAGVSGMTFVDAELAADPLGLYRPSNASPELTADESFAIGDFSYPTHDMDGQVRSEITTIGADETFDTTPSRGPLTSALVGPLSYTPPATVGHVVKVPINNHDFDSADLTGWVNSGTEVVLNIGDVFSRGSSIKVDDAADSISQDVVVTPNTNYTLSAFVKGVGSLSVIVDGVSYEAIQTSDDYKFTRVSFNSGSVTTATIKASLPTQVNNLAPLVNAKFDDEQTGWGVYEGTGIGQVQDSSNSSDSTDGSIKFKYNDDDSGTPHDPYIAQSITVLPNTDYTLTSYSLLKSSSSGSTVLFGAFEGSDDSLLASATPIAVVIASKESIYSDLEAAGAEEGDDSFLKDSLIFNSDDNASITIFSQFQTTTGDEIRVDEFELGYMGAPANGTQAFFDSFRLVSHESLD